MKPTVHGGQHERPLGRAVALRPRHPDDLDPAKAAISFDEVVYMAEAYHNEDAARLMIERGGG